jgi:hypothetical protein
MFCASVCFCAPSAPHTSHGLCVALHVAYHHAPASKCWHTSWPVSMLSNHLDNNLLIFPEVDYCGHEDWFASGVLGSCLGRRARCAPTVLSSFTGAFFLSNISPSTLSESQMVLAGPLSADKMVRSCNGWWSDSMQMDMCVCLFFLYRVVQWSPPASCSPKFHWGQWIFLSVHHKSDVPMDTIHAQR